MLYGGVFTTIHKPPLFMTHSCCTTFRSLDHISLLQYTGSSNVWAFRRTLAHISTGYPCVSSSWTQWMKNNNIPNYSQELKKGFDMAKFLLFKLPLVIFCFHGNLVADDVVASLIYLCFIYTLLFFYKSKRCMC